MSKSAAKSNQYSEQLTVAFELETVHLRHRMNIVQAAFNPLFKILKDHCLSLSIKDNMYRTAVRFTLTHACEAWEFTEESASTACVSTSSPQTPTEKQLPTQSLIWCRRFARLRYYEHILRMDEERFWRVWALYFPFRFTRERLQRREPQHPDPSCQEKNGVNLWTLYNLYIMIWRVLF